MTDYATLYQYAVNAHTSLAPLSRFCGSHITTAHEQQCCRFQSYAKTAIANEIYKRNWQSVNHIPGIHDNGPRDHGLWRLTLTAYSKHLPDAQGLQTLLFIKSSICTRVLVIKAYIKIKVWLLGSLTCNHRFFFTCSDFFAICHIFDRLIKRNENQFQCMILFLFCSYSPGW